MTHSPLEIVQLLGELEERLENTTDPKERIEIQDKIFDLQEEVRDKIIF